MWQWRYLGVQLVLLLYKLFKQQVPGKSKLKHYFGRRGTRKPTLEQNVGEDRPEGVCGQLGNPENNSISGPPQQVQHPDWASSNQVLQQGAWSTHPPCLAAACPTITRHRRLWESLWSTALPPLLFPPFLLDRTMLPSPLRQSLPPEKEPSRIRQVWLHGQLPHLGNLFAISESQHRNL